MALRPNPHRMAPDRFTGREFPNILTLAAMAILMAACGGGGSEAIEATSIGNEAAAPPTGATSSSPNTAILTWDAVTDPNLSGYRVYYGTAPGTYVQSPGQGISVGNVTSYVVSGLRSGTRYYFTVTAFDTSNNESSFSNEVFKDIS